jgi:hypothetical protein
MYPHWFSAKIDKKSGTNAKKSTIKKRPHLSGRQLAMESLEDRSLLSVGLGMPHVIALGPLLSSSAQVSHFNIPVAQVASQLTMALPQNVPNSEPVLVQLTARDAQNHLVRNYTGTVNLTSTDPSATLPASVTLVNGFATFKASFVTPGQQTITATDSADATLTVSATTNVADPLVATHFKLVARQNVPNGAEITVKLIALDAQDRLVKNYTGTVNLESTDPGATMPADVTFQNGFATFQATFVTPGQQTITATDAADSSLTGSVTINVAEPLVATQFKLIARENVPSGEQTTVYIVALDAQNRLVKNYNGTVNLTNTDSGATMPSSVTFKEGIASFQVTFATEGQQTINAVDSADASLVGSATINVTAPLVATHFKLITLRNAPLGQPVMVLMVALDAQNRPVRSYSGTVNLTTTDTSAILPSTVTFNEGFASFQVTFNTVGRQTITATDGTNSSLLGTATTNVIMPRRRPHF